MNNFEYSNPTRLVFGKGEESRIGELMRARVPAMSPVLVVYGGGSAKASGLLERISESLKTADLVPIELGGVTPNPQLSFVQKGILLAREHRVRAILAVGGGSVIDASKAIAIGVPYVGDVWDFFTEKITPTEALPVAAVLTLPAAGSEQSIRIVISNGDRKLGAGSPLVRPFVSVIDPELFFTLPEKQIRAGVIDMMSHIMERYFTQTKNTDFVDSQAESAMKTIMKNGLKLKKNPKDYDAWCQIGLAGSFAHNGYYGLGQVEDWASHGMEHVLSAWDTTITRGVKVDVIIDKKMPKKKPNTTEDLLKAGVPTFFDTAHRTAHDKIIIVDDNIVLTGSFNFVKVAETKNGENLLILKSKPLAEEYVKNWEKHFSHSVLAAPEKEKGTEVPLTKNQN